MKTYPIVLVTWEDAKSTDDWTKVDDLDFSPVICETVGYLLKDGEVVIVASTVGVDNDGDVDTCCVMHIPRCCVKDVKTL